MKFFSNISPNLRFIGAIIILSTLTWSIAFFKKEIKTYQNSISVIGVATKDVTSDQAVWRISIIRQSLDRAQNVKNLATDEKMVKEYLEKLGLPASDWSPTRITVNTLYQPKENGYGDTNIVDAYETRVSFSQTTSKVKLVETAIADLQRFGEEQQINLVGNEAEYTYTAWETEKIPLLQQAIEDAQKRAEALVTATHGVSKTKIGKILSAQQGVFQVNSRYDESVSDYGNLDTSSIAKTIRATVKVDFSAQ